MVRKFTKKEAVKAIRLCSYTSVFAAAGNLLSIAEKLTDAEGNVKKPSYAERAVNNTKFVLREFLVSVNECVDDYCQNINPSMIE